MADHILGVLDTVPVVTCPGCAVPMTLRQLEPQASADRYTATFQCDRCFTETKRELKANKSSRQ